MAPSRLSDDDIGSAVELHQRAMAGEFLAAGGDRFLRAYYRAWLASPAAVGLCVRGGDGQALGVLLGSVNPGLHYRSMVRTSGAVLACLLLGHALTHPRWGLTLVRTRARRYLRGLFRLLRRRGMTSAGTAPAGTAPDPRPIAEVTYLMVAPEARGRGYARALLDEAGRLALDANAEALVVVTRSGGSAERFYERLEWTRVGAVVSASGERFVRYEKRL